MHQTSSDVHLLSIGTTETSQKERSEKKNHVCYTTLSTKLRAENISPPASYHSKSYQIIVFESMLSILLIGTTLIDVDDAVGGILDYLRI